jgi:hypothetical protein
MLCTALTLILLWMNAPAGAGVTDDVMTIGLRTAPQGDQDRMMTTLKTARAAAPKPPAPYALATNGVEDKVGTKFGTLEGTTRVIPLVALAERIYEAPAAAGTPPDQERTLEIRVAINGARDLSTGLGTVGATPHLFKMTDALAVEQSIIGADGGSRVAVPLDKEAAANALTLLRVYVTDPAMEERLRRIASVGTLPTIDPSQLVSARSDSVRSIIVEFYGSKKDVESLARRVDVKSLRKLLTS